MDEYSDNLRHSRRTARCLWPAGGGSSGGVAMAMERWAVVAVPLQSTSARQEN